MINNILSKPVMLERAIVLYWFLFFLMNGLDKYLIGRDLLLFRWFGKERTGQFSSYFARADLPHEWIDTAIYAVGAWEIALALFFLAAGFNLLRRNREQQGRNSMISGLVLAVLTLTVFSVFDVIAGDRGELLEHNIYLGMVILSWFVITYRRDRAVESHRSLEQSEAIAAYPVDDAERQPGQDVAANGHSPGSNGIVQRRHQDDDVQEPVLDLARNVARRHPYISAGLISRRFEIDQRRAESVMAALESEGLVIPARRSVLSRSR